MLTNQSTDFFFFQAEDGIRVPLWSRGLGHVYKRRVGAQDVILSEDTFIRLNIEAF